MGDIYLYTGDGAGKTTNALGLVLRSLGHGHHVVMICFLKYWKNTGEYKFAQATKGFDLFLCGREGWHGFNNITDHDKWLAKFGLWEAYHTSSRWNTKLLILDELSLALHLKLVTMEDVNELLDRIPEDVDVVITGRHAPQALIDRADIVNEVVEIKAPKEMICKEGIQW